MTGTDLRRHIDKGIPVLYNGEIFTPIGFTYIRNKHETICSAWLQSTDGTHRFTVDFDDIVPEDELQGIERIGGAENGSLRSSTPTILGEKKDA